MDGVAVADFEVIEARRGGGVLGWVLVGAALLAGALAYAVGGPVRAGLIALAFLVLAIPAFLIRPPRARWRLGLDAVEMEETPPQTIGYDQISAVFARMGGRGKQLVAHSVGLQAANQWHECESGRRENLGRFIERLVMRAGYRSSAAVHAELRAFAADQARRFGSDRVFHFGSREGPLSPHERVAGWGFAIAVFFALLIAGVSPASTDAAIAGGVCLMVTLFFVVMIVLSLRVGEYPKALRNSGVVLGPQGLALVQGDVRGQLSWEEIRSLALSHGTVHPQWIGLSRNLPSVRLQLEGADVFVLDLYDRPLMTIERTMRMYWKGDLTCVICNGAIPATSGPACAACAPAPEVRGDPYGVAVAAEEKSPGEAASGSDGA